MFRIARGVNRNVGGTGHTYSYWCEQPRPDYGGDPPTTYWPEQQIFTAGACHRMGNQVIMNTPGQRNGVIRQFVNGKMVHEKTNYMFRQVGNNLQIDRLFLQMMYGGASADWANNVASWIEYRNLRVYTDPPSCP